VDSVLGKTMSRYEMDRLPGLDDIAVFDFAAGNRDRHEGNVWITPDGRTVAVDQGFSFERSTYCHDTFYPKPFEGAVPLTPKQRGWLERVSKTVESSASEIGITESEARDVAIRARYMLNTGRVPHREDRIEVARYYPKPVIKIVKNGVTIAKDTAGNVTKSILPKDRPDGRHFTMGVTSGSTLPSFLRSDNDSIVSGFHDPNIQIKIGEARLKEHPGHSDQKVHGRRGDAAVDLMGKVEDVEYFSEQGNMSTTYTLRIGGHIAFAKQANSEDLMREMGAQAVNDFGGGLVNIPRSVLRSDPATVSEFDQDAPVMISEFIDGQRMSRVRGYSLYEHQDVLDDIQTFDFVTGGVDRHLGNMLVDAKGKVWCVDQAWTFSNDLRGAPDYTAGAPDRPLTPRQRAFVQTFAGEEPLALAKKVRIPVPKAATLIWRAKTVLGRGTIPTTEDRRADNDHMDLYVSRGIRPPGFPDFPEKYNFDFFTSPVSEAALQEHGDHDQQTHGRRGPGVHNPVHRDLKQPIVKLESMAGGMHPCWKGTLADGTRVFVKESYLTEHRYEMAAESLNVFGMEGVDDEFGGAAAGLVRMPHAEISRADTPNHRGGLSSSPVVVTEWVNGKMYGDAKNNPRLIQSEVDDIIVFDFVTANQDRHAGNAMVTLTGHVWSIDHGQTFGDVPNPTMLARTVQMGRVPLNGRQRTWLTKIATTPREQITEVLNSRVRDLPGATPFHGGYARALQQRAQDLLDFGHVPMETDVGTFEYSGFLPPLSEALLQEHGDHDQKSHGRSAGGRAGALKRTRAARGQISDHWASSTDRAFDKYLGWQKSAAGSQLNGEPGSVEVIDHGYGYEMHVLHDEEGRPAAYAQLRPSHREIEGVEVRPSLRGKGYGFRLYDAVQDGGKVNLYDYLARADQMTPAGKQFALAWLKHRVKLEGGR
jgi:GNAT superfamily N-acetyltransferase